MDSDALPALIRVAVFLDPVKVGVEPGYPSPVLHDVLSHLHNVGEVFAAQPAAVRRSEEHKWRRVIRVGVVRVITFCAYAHQRGLERPQHLLMRVALGIHKGWASADGLRRALETYDLMSKRYFVHASTGEAAAHPRAAI